MLMMPITVQYLRNREWTMGNGQCHDCCGLKPDEWAPHPCATTPADEGHKPNCLLAKCLEELNQTVQYISI